MAHEIGEHLTWPMRYAAILDAYHLYGLHSQLGAYSKLSIEGGFIISINPPFFSH